ncbi:MAG: hypothetical protein IJU45_00085 [Clostridia bacterium]|nr:hypothetical protein [Clostridia bacterium]
MKIVNKIVSFILAAAVFPFMITQVLIKLVLSVNENSLAYSLIKMFLGDDNKITGSRLAFEESVLDFFNLLTGKQSGAFGIDLKTFISTLPEDFDHMKKLIVVSGIFIALGILITIIILGCVLFTNAYKTIAGLALGGSICFAVSTFIFGKAARPLIDGTVSIVDALSQAISSSGQDAGDFASGLLSDAVKVDSFALGGAVYFAMFALFGLAIWEFSYVVTLPKPKEA